MRAFALAAVVMAVLCSSVAGIMSITDPLPTTHYPTDVMFVLNLVNGTQVINNNGDYSLFPNATYPYLPWVEEVRAALFQVQNRTATAQNNPIQVGLINQGALVYQGFTNNSADVAAALASVNGVYQGTGSWPMVQNFGPTFQLVFNQFQTYSTNTTRRKLCVFISNTASQTDISMYARTLKLQNIEFLMVAIKDDGVGMLRLTDDTKWHDFSRLASHPQGRFALSTHIFDGYSRPWFINTLIARIRDDAGYACHSVGDGHFITFDSNIYGFEGVGEYWLAVSQDPTNMFAVEIKQAMCEAAFQPGNNVYTVMPRVACTRAVAMTNGMDTFNFISGPSATGAVTSVLAIWNGQPLQYQPQFQTPSGTYVYTSRRFNDVVAQVAYPDGTIVDMQFGYYGVIVFVIPKPSLLANLNGLCGLYDGLPFNDFTNRWNQTVPSGTTSAVLAANFSQTWFVPPMDSLFFPDPTITFGSPVGDEFTYSTWQASYAIDDGPLVDVPGCDAIPQTMSWRYPSTNGFFREICYSDFQATGSLALATVAFFSQCLFYCAEGQPASSLITGMECNKVCSHKDAAIRFNMHTVYNAQNLPDTVQLDGVTKPQIFFRNQERFGGTFGLNLQITDGCGISNQPVNVQIQCLNPPVVNQAAILPNPNIVWTRYGYPEVWFNGTAASTLPLYYSWKWLVTPPNPYVPASLNVTYEPFLFPNDVSANVYFLPEVPGQYVIEYSVNDGCATVRKQIPFTVGCGPCVPAPIVVTPEPAVWNNLNGANKFFPATNTGQESVISSMVNFPGDCYSRPLSPDWALSTAANASGTNWIVAITQDRPNGAYYKTYEIQTPGVSYSTSQTMPAMNSTTGPQVQAGPFYYLNQFTGVSEPLYFVEATSQTWTSTVVQQLSTVATTNAICIANMSAADPLGATITFEVQPEPTISNLQCLGTYGVTYSVFDGCNLRSDTQPIAAQCSNPQSRIKCHQAYVNNYDWATNTFPSVNVDGEDSYDPYPGSTITTAYWSGLATAPATQSPMCGYGQSSCDLSPQGQLTLNTPITPIYGGIANIRLTTGNGCGAGTDFLALTVYCQGPSLIKAAVTPGSSGPFAYNGNDPNSKDFTVDGTPSQTPSTANQNKYYWSLVSAPVPSVLIAGTPGFVAPALVQNGGPGSPTAQVQNTLAGSYTLRLDFDGGCNISTVSFPVTVTCPETVTVVMAGGQTQGITYVYTGAWSGVGLGGNFAQITLDASGSTVTSGGNPFPSTLSYAWTYLTGPATTSPLQNEMTAQAIFPPTTLPGTYTFRVAVHDPCVYSFQNVQVNLQCNAPNTWSPQPSVTTNNVGTQNVYGVTFTLNAATSGNAPNAQLIWTWTLVSKPATSQLTSPPAQQSPPDITPDSAGVYVWRVTASDGCWTIQAQVQATVACPPWSLVTYSYPSVQYTDQQCVTLKADGSQLTSAFNNIDPTSFAFRWDVTAAPATSVYRPTTTVATTSNTVSTGPQFSQIGLQRLNITNTTITSVTTTTSRYVTLLPQTPHPDGKALFEVCFRPDVQGSYSIRLTAQTTQPGNAQECVLTSTATVGVQCAANPIVSIKPIPQTQLKRALINRVILDGSLSSPGTNPNRLYYRWTQTAPATGPAALIYNADQLVATVIPLQSAFHTFVLTISDGCASASATVSFTTFCENNTPFNSAVTVTAPYDGTIPVNAMTVAWNYQDNAQLPLAFRYCQNYQWSLINFTPAVNLLGEDL